MEVSVPTPEVELTDEEVAIALKQARNKKIGELNLQKWKEEISRPKVYPRFTPEEFRKILLDRNPEFELNESNEEIFWKLCLYFTGTTDSRSGLSLKKGLLLHGNIGCGKTTMMRMFAVNQHRTFFVKSCRQPVYEYEDKDQGGDKIILSYSRPEYDSSAAIKLGHQQVGICFDDLGTEENINRFGNKVNVMQNILLERYDKLAFNFTHITTNLSAELIKEQYGQRVADRMNEMFNLIEFPIDAKSWRV